jgi:hypothetical protein
MTNTSLGLDPTNEGKLRKCELSATFAGSLADQVGHWSIIFSKLSCNSSFPNFFRYFCHIFQFFAKFRGYRTLNFKIIPSELESLGKKVCVDDHGSAFIILFYNMTLIAFCPKFTKKYNKQFLKDPVIGKLLPALEYMRYL